MEKAAEVVCSGSEVQVYRTTLHFLACIGCGAPLTPDPPVVAPTRKMLWMWLCWYSWVIDSIPSQG